MIPSCGLSRLDTLCAAAAAARGCCCLLGELEVAGDGLEAALKPTERVGPVEAAFSTAYTQVEQFRHRTAGIGKAVVAVGRLTRSRPTRKGSAWI